MLDYIRVIADFISQPRYKDLIPMFRIMNQGTCPLHALPSHLDAKTNFVPPRDRPLRAYILICSVSLPGLTSLPSLLTCLPQPPSRHRQWTIHQHPRRLPGPRVVGGLPARLGPHHSQHAPVLVASITWRDSQSLTSPKVKPGEMSVQDVRSDVRKNMKSRLRESRGESCRQSTLSQGSH